MALELKIRLSAESDVDCSHVGRLLDRHNNDAISRLRIRKAILKTQMKETLLFAYEHKAIISAVRCIPADVLLEIFSYLLPKMPCHDYPEPVSDLAELWNRQN